MNKKVTYLLIGHGSPKKSGNKHLLQFAQKLEDYLGQKVYLGALEHFEPDLETVLETVCQEAETTDIVVMPLFLFAAYHCKKDIPPYLQRAQERFPDKKIHYSPALGNHPLMLDIVHESIEKMNQQSQKIDPEETMLLVIGRGTSDEGVIQQLQQIGTQIAEKWGFPKLEFCYMAVNQPTFEEGVKLCAQTKVKRIVVVPYLLFYGALVDKIIKTFNELNQARPDLEIHVTKVLGTHSNLLEAVVARSQEEVEFTTPSK